MTEDDGPPKAEVPRFRSVMHTKLGDLQLLLATGVDAAAVAEPLAGTPYQDRYVDFATIAGYTYEPGRDITLYG